MIYVFGSINFDLTIFVDRFPEIGETIKGDSIFLTLGGKGANQAISVKKLNGDVLFIGKLGDDYFGKYLLNTLNFFGLKYEIKIEKGVNSGIAIINVDKNGKNKIVIYEGANGKVGDDELILLKDKIKKDDILLLQGEIPIKTIHMSAKIAKENGTIVIFDPAPAKKDFLEIIPYVDYLTPNESELEILTENINNFEDKIEFLLSKGVNSIIAKLGERGCYYKDKSGLEYKVPAYKVNAIDTTAAGDIFNGAFAVAIQKNCDIFYSLKFANAAAAISVTRKGASVSCPEYNEVIKFMEEYDEKSNN
ncbi:MAG: ribokinase [Caldisericia bacterium]|jgi:ribokinase|nr:ribokinase [Caldisericia bacterium]